MAKSGNNRIGLLGGTFDPIHKGHLKLAEAALRQYDLAKVYLVLSPTSPFKVGTKKAPLKDRLRMIALAIQNKPLLFVGKWELKKRGASFTVNTLKRVAKEHRSVDLYLIMGSDAWAGFPRWKSPGKILGLSTLLVGRRPGSKKIKIPKRYKPKVKVLRGEFPDISSTDARREPDAKKLSQLLPAPVYSYCQKRHLYQ